MTAASFPDWKSGAGLGDRLCQIVWLLAVFLAVGGAGRAAAANGQSARLTLAILTFEDQTADPKAAHWRFTIERLLADQLSEAKALRRIPGAFGFRQLKVKPGGPISVEEARKIGELIEARRVVWGSYRRDGQQWLVTARVLNVASGKAGPELKAASTNWFAVRDQLAAQLLPELGVKPAEAERRNMARHWTVSPAALEAYSRAYAGQHERRPRADIEASIRQALEADPQFVEAHEALAAVLGSQGKSKPAEAAALEAVKLCPGSANARQVLGCMLMFQRKFAEALTELRKAMLLDPDDAETLARLGECAQALGNPDDAIAFWNDAIRLDPTDAGIHAHLGYAYAKERNREKAVKELKEAERLDPEEVNSEQIIWQGYAALHETPLALQHLERFVALARKQGLDPAMVDYTAECGRELRARLTPHELSVAPPRSYTPQSLAAALRERLTRDECKEVVNPFASTPAMDRWTQELTRGATNDLAKARTLFDALARPVDPGETGTRTAQEVFAAWNKPGQSFCGLEYANLYVALARAAGLKAFFVHLERDYSGEIVYHDCAAVFTDGKALLVDPACQWFGAPHKQYVILDDLQAIAHQFYQPSRKGGEVARCRLAAKLHPDTAWGQLHLVGALISANELVEADKALKRAEQLEPGRWDAYAYRGLLAVAGGGLENAVADLRKSLELNPKYGRTHFVLAWVLTKQGKLEDARDEYRLSLLYGTLVSVEDKAAALRAIADINEKLAAK